MTRIATNTIKFVHEDDPKQAIIDAAGDLEGYTVYGPRILVGVYQPPKGDATIEHGTLKLIAPDITGGTKEEYAFQGRVCLVLKKGSLAFKDDEATQFHRDDVQVGDWVVIKPLDGGSISVGKQLCRLVNDHHIQMTVPHPDAVF